MTSLYHAEILHIGQAALSTYGVLLSAIAIANLRQYESASEKAAKVSSTAADQLHRTRTTQTSGLLGVATSLAVSVTLATSWRFLPPWARVLASPATAAGLNAVRAHIRGFWSGGGKVPLAAGYNGAIQKTEELLGVLKWLQYSWVVSAVLAGVVGYR